VTTSEAPNSGARTGARIIGDVLTLEAQKP
jgi:hypothetical protein